MDQSAVYFVRQRNKLLFSFVFSASMKALIKGSSVSSILLVENMKGVRRAIAALLKNAGHDVTEAEDCTTAQLCLAAKTFDLVICEICPSHADGAALMTHLNQQTPRPPVIAIFSGNSQIAAEMNPLLNTTCANVVLQKPLSEEDLLTEVQKLLYNEIVSIPPAAIPEA